MHDLYNFITNYRGIYHVDTKYIKIFMIYRYSLIYLYFMIIMCNMYLFIFENYLVFFPPHFVIYYISIHIHNLHEAKLLFLKHIYKKFVY